MIQPHGVADDPGWIATKAGLASSGYLRRPRLLAPATVNLAMPQPLGPTNAKRTARATMSATMQDTIVAAMSCRCGAIAT
jgi:hypothetical protein